MNFGKILKIAGAVTNAMGAVDPRIGTVANLIERAANNVEKSKQSGKIKAEYFMAEFDSYFADGAELAGKSYDPVLLAKARDLSIAAANANAAAAEAVQVFVKSIKDKS